MSWRSAVMVLAMTLMLAPAASAASRADLDQAGRTALQQLYRSSNKAPELAQKAQAVLIFPRILKAGFMFGGQTGNGVLFIGDRPAGYYNISAGSFGFQAGAQTFSYALFFMTNDSLSYLQRSEGWAIGSGPSVVILDKAAAKNVNSTTLGQAVYAIPFGQQGLMAGIGLEGSKITPIHPH